MYIDPGQEDPKDHIRFRRAAIYSLTVRGKETIKRLRLQRSDLEETRLETFQDLKHARFIAESSKTDFKQRDIDEAREILESSEQPDKKLSAMARDFLEQ